MLIYVIIQSLEESAESLRDRCLKFYKGCHKYTEGLGEAYDGDIAFASSLETFGGGHNDPISVAFGGPVMTKFTIALREIGTYKEVLRSQVEHILNDRLLQFVEIDLHEVKDTHKHFDKASLLYDQVCIWDCHIVYWYCILSKYSFFMLIIILSQNKLCYRTVLYI
ncbi:hypothetical protein B296_00042534 [Ensete ventricosum]|uniref:BAR domain-containing protein n=1 Tax=Ensete ventricosum TaxID=4639 RepID=A0A426Z465_ENSVE|nr:hypothetical protein B296_00042534 [Ensete ventricosum]